jgi:hypothetical protein
MTPYKHNGGDTGILAFGIGTESIVIKFQDESIYLYTCASAGRTAIEDMKMLAVTGKGLTTYINKYVKNKYDRKLR